MIWFVYLILDCNAEATFLQFEYVETMKYRLTPLNFFCAFLVGLEIVFFIFPDSLKNEHYGYQHVFLIPVIIVGFIDLVLQKTIKRYAWLLVIHVVLITSTILLNVKF